MDTDLRELPAPSLERRITALLELFGLSDTREQRIASYSKGMKQKVLVIAALLHDPDVLILDEPDSGLDVTAALVMRHLVGNLAARGKVIIYTSHVLDVVEKLCTRVIVLHEGRVVADDSVTRLFVQRFVENDLISPDADRVQALSQACAALLTGGLFVSMLLSLPYLQSPYPLPSRTAANMIRVQFLYTAWSSTVMALVALSVWDALSLDSRDTDILGPLPLRRGVIVRAKVSALIMFAAGFAAALNVVPRADPPPHGGGADPSKQRRLLVAAA